MPNSDLNLFESPASLGNIFWSTSSRILVLYALLLFFFVGLTIPVFRYIVVRQVQHRVTDDLRDDLLGFLDYVEAANDELVTGDVTSLNNTIDSFLEEFRAEDDNFLIFITDNEFYRSSPLVLPTAIQSGSPFLDERINFEGFQEGVIENPGSETGNLIYRIKPVQVNGIRLGSVIGVHTSRGEIEEALESIQLFIGMIALTGSAALFLAWFSTRVMLKPVQELAQTSRSIRENDLTQRATVKGSGELAYLGKTFNQMMDRLQAAFDIQQKFLRDASHELRTPLTIVQGHLELLEDPTPVQEESLKIVTSELERMGRLVNDLTLLARSESPDFLNVTPINIALFTEDVLSKMRMLGDRDWHLEAKASGTFSGDQQSLTGALLNLAENAALHTEIGDEIAIGSAVRDGIVRFWIRDVGPGIEPHERERIFQRFARGANTTKSPGSGLGLAIVKAKAEAHGGWVELSSQLGVGSTFTISIPLNPTFSE